MKILYDHQIFTMQRWGGISRYFSELIKEIGSEYPVDIRTSTKFSNNEYLLELDNSGCYPFFPKSSFRGIVRFQKFFNRYNTQRIMQQGNFDIFHPTYYHPYFIPRIGKNPVVITVYDMIHERFPTFFSRGNKITEFKKKVLERADKIIAISKQTRNDLIEIFGIDENRIEVVYLGNSLNHQMNIQQVEQLPLPKKYILFVGVRGGYKNFKTFLESIVPLILNDDDLHLVCVGGGSFGNSEIEFLKENKLLKKCTQISCSDHELRHVYRNAQCFVFPSLYEGFGLPLLEAFSAKCPIACSNRGSLPEVADEAAILFNPESEHEIREAVQKVLYDDYSRETLIQKGTKRGEKFSWKETARQTLTVYESLA